MKLELNEAYQYRDAEDVVKDVKMLLDRFPDERFLKLERKYVEDSDGFDTDYTWYFDRKECKYVFVFGDNELYLPEDGDYDWEVEAIDCDDLNAAQEALDWYDNYHGFEEENDEELKLEFDESTLDESDDLTTADDNNNEEINSDDKNSSLIPQPDALHTVIERMFKDSDELTKSMKKLTLITFVSVRIKSHKLNFSEIDDNEFIQIVSQQLKLNAEPYDTMHWNLMKYFCKYAQHADWEYAMDRYIDWLLDIKQEISELELDR